MFWTSVLPVTIFMLANTLCVSESAATGGRQRLRPDTLEGGSRIVKRVGSSSFSLQPEFASSSSSSLETSLPEWNNPHTTPNKNDMLQVQENDDDDIEDDEEGNNEVWEEGPLPSPLVGGRRFKYAAEEQSDPVIVQPLFYRDRMGFSSPPEIEEIPQTRYNMRAAEAAGNRFHYSPIGVGVVERLKPLPLYKKSQLLASQQQPSQQVAWSLAKSNYRVPAEGFIRANGFDKRSPRCIAKCMQQGMVHPLQCHSLC